MSTQEPTDDNDDQKVEPKYLTLADKQPSLTRRTGNESAQTISTRQLSDNLQKTRDGLINLMRNMEGNDKLLSAHGSDSETDDEGNNTFQKFGTQFRGKKSATQENAQKPGGMTGSALYDITNKTGKLGEFASEVFDPNGRSRLSSQDQHLRTKKSQRGKHGSNSDWSDERAAKNLNNENDKRFVSQNPKKDGPLHTRIFIDAFLPSLEGNRISPLFNYRCKEIIDRTSADFYERNRKRINKQLAAVNSTDEVRGNDNRATTTVQQIQNGKELQTVQVFQDEEEVRKVVELQKVEELTTVKDDQNIEEMKDVDQSQMTEEQRQLNEVKQIQKLEKIVEGEQKVEEVESLQKADVVKDLHEANEMKEVLELQKVQEAEKLKVVLPPSDSVHPAAVVASVEDSENKSEPNDRKERTEKDSDQSVKPTHVNQPSAEEEKLLQTIYRALTENEEFIDFLCEKVISKIAARNDFCGTNCMGKCGGLNNPSEKNK